MRCECSELQHGELCDLCEEVEAATLRVIARQGDGSVCYGQAMKDYGLEGIGIYLDSGAVRVFLQDEQGDVVTINVSLDSACQAIAGAYYNDDIREVHEAAPYA